MADSGMRRWKLSPKCDGGVLPVGAGFSFKQIRKEHP